MKITVKLYAMLSDYLPADARNRSVEVDVGDQATPHEIIDRFHVPRELAHLVLLNGVYVEPGDRDKPAIKDGDTLAVWPPIAGGSPNRTSR